jgi:hypothetical protein
MESVSQVLSTSPEQLNEPLAAVSPKEDRKQVEALLAEARNTKSMLEHFKGAVSGGRFDGGSMLALAQGLAFVDAILNQNKAHIDNLQGRLK